MSRQRYLVTYDVTDDKRRTRVFKTLKCYGHHVQYSVFVCDLSRTERLRLTGRLGLAINQSEDQVLFVDMGPAHLEAGEVVDSVGRAYLPPTVTRVV